MNDKPTRYTNWRLLYQAAMRYVDWQALLLPNFQPLKGKYKQNDSTYYALRYALITPIDNRQHSAYSSKADKRAQS